MVDVFHAFEEVGVSLSELLEYFNEMEVNTQFDPAVPSFPVHKAQSHIHRCAGFNTWVVCFYLIVVIPGNLLIVDGVHIDENAVFKYLSYLE